MALNLTPPPVIRGQRALEDPCEDAIVEAALMLGYRVHTERPAKSAEEYRTAIKGLVGWPDVTIIGHGHAWFVELKRSPNKPSPDQIAWLGVMNDAGLDARLLWVPEQMQEFITELTTHRTNHMKRKP